MCSATLCCVFFCRFCSSSPKRSTASSYANPRESRAEPTGKRNESENRIDAVWLNNFLFSSASGRFRVTLVWGWRRRMPHYGRGGIWSNKQRVKEPRQGRALEVFSSLASPRRWRSSKLIIPKARLALPRPSLVSLSPLIAETNGKATSSWIQWRNERLYCPQSC